MDHLQCDPAVCYVTTLMVNCSLLSEELRDLGGAFFRALSGTAAMSSAEKYAYQLSSGLYSEPVAALFEPIVSCTLIFSVLNLSSLIF